MSFWEGKRVLVAGGTGFIGSHLVECLVESAATVRVPTRHQSQEIGNLQNCRKKIQLIRADLLKMDDCERVMKGIDVVFNLAAEVGGIGFQISHHAPEFTINALLNLTLLEAARLQNVERYQCTSSTCVYSREKSLNAQEADAFLGYPEPTVAGYGWAKRMAEIQASFYASDYGMKIAIVRPTNAYGPRDDFSEETSHVIPAIIRRVFKSQGSVTVWGSGDQTRSFIYVEDVARGMMDATERYAIADPLNLGTDVEITMRNLTHMIAELIGKKLQLEFDKNRPEGQPRKYADSSKAKRVINWAPQFSLEEGIRKTISWYKEKSNSP